MDAARNNSSVFGKRARLGCLAAVLFLSTAATGPAGRNRLPASLQQAMWRSPGFSGAPPPAQIAPGEDPRRQDLHRSRRTIAPHCRLAAFGRAAQAQLVDAPKLLNFCARRSAKCSGRDRRRNLPPNIYVAATSVYGLPIALRTGGQTMHLRLVAERDLHVRPLGRAEGGGRIIWKIDGANGNVSLFANVSSTAGPIRAPLSVDWHYDPDFEFAFRCRPRDRIHSSLRPEWRRSRPIRPRRERSAKRKGCTGAVDSSTADRHYQPAVRQQPARDLELCSARASASSASPFISTACTTQSPPACKSGRSV